MPLLMLFIFVATEIELKPGIAVSRLDHWFQRRGGGG